MNIVFPTIAPLLHRMLAGLFFGVVFLWAQTAQADIARFAGSYHGSAEVVSSDGSASPRDMSVEIVKADDGFNVNWTSVTHRSDGRITEKSYSIDFVNTDRPNVYAAAQKKNVFGHSVQLDPMQGEPFVWARITGDTMTVYSLFVGDDGGYELQQFDRTLVENGLYLDFMRVRDGEQQKSVSTLLERQ